MKENAISDFLKSKEEREYAYEKYSNRITKIIKVGYNDRFDIIYEGEIPNSLCDTGSYGGFKLLGLLDNYDKKVYPTSNYYNKLVESDLIIKDDNEHVKTISDLEEDKKVYILNKFMEIVDNQKAEFMKLAQEAFKEYHKTEYHKSELDERARSNYLSASESDKITFNIPSDILHNYDNTEGIIKYLENKEKLSDEIISKALINEKRYKLYSHVSGVPDIDVSYKEKIGFDLLVLEEVKRIIHTIETGTDEESKKLRKIRDVLNTIEDLDAKTVIVTVKYNNKELEFKYPRNQLVYLRMSEWEVESSKRDEFNDVFKGVRYGDEISRMAAISQIKFKGKVIYTDTNMQ